MNVFPRQIPERRTMKMTRPGRLAPVILWLLALVAPSAAAETAKNPPNNFDVEKLADGVYAVIRKEGPGLMIDANNAFIIGGDGVIVVDANGSTTHTKEVLAALRKLTDKPVRYVVNTHWHDDHIMGNQVYRDAFPSVQFVGHARMRDYLATTGAKNHAQMLEQAPQFAKYLRSSLEKNKSLSGQDLSAEERASYESDISLIDQYVADAPSTEVVLPTIAVYDHLTLDVGGRAVEVRYMGSGHTAGDLVVSLPKEHILVTGDLVVWPVPLIGADQSHIGEWAETLGKLRALKPAIIVPGHGRILRDDAYLELMARFLASAKRQTDEAIARGETLEQAQKSVNLEEFRESFAGDSKVRSFLFDVYAVQPAIGAVYREAKEKH
jgi:glyoxylase-like metal-dependent hydrolase (beta-lactamase superfamily II)